MKPMKLFVSGASLILLVAGAPRTAAATTISYLATDLSDTAAGDDLWQYDYFVSGIAFDTDQGFSVGFDTALYTGLDSPPPAVSPDWDILTLQPDPGIPEDGIYDAVALVNGAALDKAFSVSFVWLGGPGAAPGSQPFTINQFDPLGNISFLDHGRTTPLVPVPVPEPSTLWLLGAATAPLLWRRRRPLPA
jgi:hypothetical protein